MKKHSTSFLIYTDQAFVHLFRAKGEIFDIGLRSDSHRFGKNLGKIERVAKAREKGDIFYAIHALLHQKHRVPQTNVAQILREGDAFFLLEKGGKILRIVADLPCDHGQRKRALREALLHGGNDLRHGADTLVFRRAKLGQGI